jgi:hypothetical protein
MNGVRARWLKVDHLQCRLCWYQGGIGRIGVIYPFALAFEAGKDFVKWSGCDTVLSNKGKCYRCSRAMLSLCLYST